MTVFSPNRARQRHARRAAHHHAQRQGIHAVGGECGAPLSESYGAFAYAYDQALGQRFFRAVRRILARVLDRFPAKKKTHLDVACGTGLAIGGSSDPSSPVTSPGTGYVDYLDLSGQPVASTANWYYIRVWQISQPSTNLKQITVTAKVKAQVGAPQGVLPQSTLVSMKTSPF